MKNTQSYFTLLSYSVVVCGLIILLVSGGISGLLTLIFFSLTVLAWFLEKSKWQISEKVAIIAICITLVFFYFDWKFKLLGSFSGDNLAIVTMSRLIYTLALVKLFQKKNDRDWVYLYVISFFEVLLAAGQSISPVFLVVLIFYLLFSICTIIAFEIKKTSSKVQLSQNLPNLQIKDKLKLSGLSVTGFFMLGLIIVFAIPLFFIIPRVGGAGVGQSLGGNATYSGFSDSVSLGTIGKLQQSSEIVMRVKFQGQDSSPQMKWRGVALDRFDNKSWFKSQINQSNTFIKVNDNLFQKKNAPQVTKLVKQNIILEPLDSQVLFGLSEILIVDGRFNYINEDVEGGLTSGRPNWERMSYAVYSNLNSYNIEELKNDKSILSSDFGRYLQVPNNLNSNFSSLAQEIIKQAKAVNNYDKAKAIENYLQTKLSYSLEMKANGEEPLADFLFNVKAGHCEYFASSMAIMLRTQGIPTRIVNGFNSGEFNETVGMWIVRQSDAHSWVEVYFPEKKVWATFDPTPAGFQNNTQSTSFFKKYSEALETFWIQYVVAYDNQEQATLFRSFRQRYNEFQSNSSVWIRNLEVRIIEWWKDVRGDKGLQESLKAIGFALGYILAIIVVIILFVCLLRKSIKSAILLNLLNRIKFEDKARIVEFYHRMQKILANKGYKRQFHQTPQEFAFSLDIPEVIKITEKYHQVRYGDQDLSKEEAKEIDEWLKNLSKTKK